MWIAQAILAAMFAMAGLMKATQPKDKLIDRLPWTQDFLQGTVRFIGVAEPVILALASSATELVSGDHMKRWVFVVLGILLALIGTVWTLQGLDVLGQSGGMNGQRIWAVIGPITALVGLGLAAIGARKGRSKPTP